jgi:hypothetical protein
MKSNTCGYAFTILFLVNYMHNFYYAEDKIEFQDENAAHAY